MKSPTKAGVTVTLGKILQHLLADESLLAATTREFRWKVTGPNFHSLHKLFDEQRRQLDYWLDQLLERARAVGIAGRESPEATAKATESAATPGVGLPARKMIDELLALHEETAGRLRADIEACGESLLDRGTAELLTRLLEFHETTAWMLRILHDPPDAVRA